MASSDSHLRMTADDERAARVLTLAVKFFGATRPIASSTISSELYPGLDTIAFKRQFLRDRELLSTFGVVIREADGADADTLWEVDERASYIQDEGLGTKDACMLYVLCHDMAFDQAFPYRDELRMALAKISRMYRGNSIPHSDKTTPTQHKLLATLVSCMSNHHGATVTYTDARGVTSTRTLAILGSFGLRGNTYFVASRAQDDGTLVPDSVRTYRLDRFQKARELQKCQYQVPEDFSVSDYERLPFQMGDTLSTARFAISIPTEAMGINPTVAQSFDTKERHPAGIEDHSLQSDSAGTSQVIMRQNLSATPSVSSKQVMRAMATHGTTHTYENAIEWEVAYSDVDAAAAWAIGAGIKPLAPEELCTAWHDALVRAAESNPFDSHLTEYTNANQTSQQKSAGRKGSVIVARQLVALATSLTREGEVITAQNIATTLGISYDEARHLIALVSMGSGESIDYLPVILSDNDDEVSLMEGAALSARRVRLTRSESIALTAALTELGVDQDDQLFRTLTASYTSPSFSPEDVKRTLETPSSASDSDILMRCSQAISAGKGLSFAYRPVTGEALSHRRVVPQLVRRSDDSWYLDAYDLNRQGQRVFRIDRMSELAEFDAPAHTLQQEPERIERMVTVRFDDRRYLDIFHWEGMQLLTQDATGTVVRMPHYGGTWLARHLAACAGTVHIGDESLSAQVQAVAREMLSV